jgi:predicted nucleic-acid-binding protein
MHITRLANNISVLGGSITEAEIVEIVKILLQVVPEPLERVKISIETLLDNNDLTVEEVIDRLHNLDQRKKSAASTIDKQAGSSPSHRGGVARVSKILENYGNGSMSASG